MATFPLIARFHVMVCEVVEEADEDRHVCGIDSIRVQVEVGMGNESLSECVESHNPTRAIIERVRGLPKIRAPVRQTEFSKARLDVCEHMLLNKASLVCNTAAYRRHSCANLNKMAGDEFRARLLDGV